MNIVIIIIIFELINQIDDIKERQKLEKNVTYSVVQLTANKKNLKSQGSPNETI